MAQHFWHHTQVNKQGWDLTPRQSCPKVPVFSLEQIAEDDAMSPRGHVSTLRCTFSSRKCDICSRQHYFREETLPSLLGRVPGAVHLKKFQKYYSTNGQ